MATRQCIDCGKDLIPGPDWPEVHQKGKLYRHRSCNQKMALVDAVVRFRSYAIADIGSQEEWSKLVSPENKAEFRAKAIDQLVAEKVLKWKEGKTHDSVRNLDYGPNYESKKEAQPQAPAAPRPQSKPRRRRRVPSSKLVTVTTTRWDDTATSAAIHNNLYLKWGGCEYTGAPEKYVHSSHILARHLCRAMGHPEWADDEENCVFILDALNNCMTRIGFWICPMGEFLPPPGEEYPDWMIKLGIPGKRIVMSERRKFYACLAAGIPIL